MSTRGLGKAVAREFLLSGDRVVIASELEENLHEGMATSSSKKLAHAKVDGTSCDGCDHDRKLANFIVNELGSIDIWITKVSAHCCSPMKIYKYAFVCTILL